MNETSLQKKPIHPIITPSIHILVIVSNLSDTSAKATDGIALKLFDKYSLDYNQTSDFDNFHFIPRHLTLITQSVRESKGRQFLLGAR
jgi:hypothetical protein